MTTVIALTKGKTIQNVIDIHGSSLLFKVW